MPRQDQVIENAANDNNSVLADHDLKAEISELRAQVQCLTAKLQWHEEVRDWVSSSIIWGRHQHLPEWLVLEGQRITDSAVPPSLQDDEAHTPIRIPSYLRRKKK
jgi:hypothetical protein